MSDAIRQAFTTQAEFCRRTGSDFTADILLALRDILDHQSRTGARILDWPGEPMADALKLRIAGGLHALARSGRDAELSALYTTGRGDRNGILRRVLSEWDDVLYPWLDSPPQTNEVGRSGILYPGVMEIARRFGPKIELLELGASGGLNLNMGLYGYRLGGQVAGSLDSTVLLSPKWSGPDPAMAQVEIVGRRGVDLNPIDLCDTDQAEHMLAYIWPDQAERLSRAEAAIALLRESPPAISKGDAADWIEAQLAKPQDEGVTRVVFHSSFLPYVPAASHKRISDAIEEAGAQASKDRPLAWLMKEPVETVADDRLMLRCWPGDGRLEMLAESHPHGAWINWVKESG